MDILDMRTDQFDGIVDHTDFVDIYRGWVYIGLINY